MFFFQNSTHKSKIQIKKKTKKKMTDKDIMVLNPYQYCILFHDAGELSPEFFALDRKKHLMLNHFRKKILEAVSTHQLTGKIALRFCNAYCMESILEALRFFPAQFDSEEAKSKIFCDAMLASSVSEYALTVTEYQQLKQLLKKQKK